MSLAEPPTPEEQPGEAPARPGVIPKPTRRGHKLIAFLSWFCVILIAALWLLMRLAGDRWWVATLLLFGPRWVYATPLVPLILAAAIFRRRSLWILSVGAFIAIGPMMDLCIPWRAALAPERHGSTLRVMTCNTHYLATNPNSLADAIAAANPDLIALQECAPRSASLFADAGWYVRGDGEFLVASRFPIRKAQDITRYQKWWSAVGYEIQTPGGPIHFFNVHLASPHYAFRAALHREPNGVRQVQTNTLARLHGAQKLTDSQKDIIGPCLLAGDFNLPSDSTIFREHLSSFTDAFTERGFGFGLTYHAQWTVTRIDHILSGEGWECRKCWVGPDVGSPHRPLIADLEWGGSQAH